MINASVWLSGVAENAVKIPGAVGDIETIPATRIATPGGAQIPLSALAEIRKDRGPNTISRENVERKVVVMSNVAGRDLSSVVEDMSRLIRYATRRSTCIAVRWRDSLPFS